ncbi:MAG TPA: PD-(D/E)XK nuclease family protein [Vicinamibacterales bacterium]|nr:PD-(D/E)XK nuclease family protein [Vicinamibacterales bacterium]
MTPMNALVATAPPQFAFDPEKHLYTIDGQVVPSVTQVLEEERFIDFSVIPGETLEQAKARGTYVHTVLHYYLEGDFDLADVDERFRGYVDSALEYLAVAGMKPLRGADGTPIAVEYRFWDPDRRFAGTMDYLAYDSDGVLAINDWKTGEPSDVAAPLQTAAYEYGVRKFLLPTVLPTYAKSKKPIRRRAVKLYRDGKRGRPEPYEDPRDLAMFFCALSCVHFRRNHQRHL